MLQIKQSKTPVLEPQPGCSWAETAVLNPAIVCDPDTGDLHMLFRATGPYREKQRTGHPLPYPIFLGYAVSRDNGKTWEADFSRPALAPRLCNTYEALFITNYHGKKVVNYANGCIEDPRIFKVNGDWYLSAACRLFPPGPFWEKDEPLQCAPAWAMTDDHDLGIAASENITVTVLYALDINALRRQDYQAALQYITHISQPDRSDNRDVFLFPETFMIHGRPQYVLLHRPHHNQYYPGTTPDMRPSIWLAAAEAIEDFGTGKETFKVLAEPRFDWETDKIGASWAPLKINENSWLLPYHGKKDPATGYTQSFMILSPGDGGWPTVIHRCPDRLMYARHPWELNGLLTAPCVFTTAGILLKNTTLFMAYGAADTRIGTAIVNLVELIKHIKQYDSIGKR